MMESKLTKKNLALGVGGLSLISGLLSQVDPEILKNLGGDLLQLQIGHYTIAFILAWKLVKRDMSKDMGTKFTMLTDAVNGVRDEMKGIAGGLAAHGQEIENLTMRVTTLEKGEK